MKKFLTWRKLLMAGAVVHGCAVLFGAITLLQEIQSFQKMQASMRAIGDIPDALIRSVSFADTLVTIYNVCYWSTVVGIYVCMIGWTYAISNLARIRETGEPDVKLGSVIAWFFVPFANFVLPPRRIIKAIRTAGFYGEGLVTTWWVILMVGVLGSRSASSNVSLALNKFDHTTTVTAWIKVVDEVIAAYGQQAAMLLAILCAMVILFFQAKNTLPDEQEGSDKLLQPELPLPG